MTDDAIMHHKDLNTTSTSFKLSSMVVEGWWFGFSSHRTCSQVNETSDNDELHIILENTWDKYDAICPAT